jgi:hypothetical protein
MCAVCHEVETLTTNEALDVIAKAMSNPDHDAQHLSALLDKVLEMGQIEYDEEIAEAWERDRR